jgi:GntR family transcriptional regulator/MocR family aminotransferase
LHAVPFSLVGRSDLTGEIYRQLRRAILDRRVGLVTSCRLPGTGQRTEVSRTTVAVAYNRIQARLALLRFAFDKLGSGRNRRMPDSDS